MLQQGLSNVMKGKKFGINMVNDKLAKGLEKLIKSKNGDFASGAEIEKKMATKV